MHPDPDAIVHALQLATSPVILISACGLLLLSMTNRLARVIDRARILAKSGATARDLQLTIILRRAGFLRSAILYNAISIFFTLLLVLLLFVSTILPFSVATAVAGLFVLSILSLVTSLAFMIRDIYDALHAMHAEVNSAINSSPTNASGDNP
jgi:hypothetical protein